MEDAVLKIVDQHQMLMRHSKKLMSFLCLGTVCALGRFLLCLHSLLILFQYLEETMLQRRVVLPLLPDVKGNDAGLSRG